MDGSQLGPPVAAGGAGAGLVDGTAEGGAGATPVFGSGAGGGSGTPCAAAGRTATAPANNAAMNAAITAVWPVPAMLFSALRPFAFRYLPPVARSRLHRGHLLSRPHGAGRES